MLHLEHYVKLFELFKEESRKQTVNLASVESKIATIEKWLQDNKLSDTTILPLEEIQSTHQKDEKEYAELSLEIKNNFRKK